MDLNTTKEKKKEKMRKSSIKNKCVKSGLKYCWKKREKSSNRDKNIYI
jgi:hypothetical protein